MRKDSRHDQITRMETAAKDLIPKLQGKVVSMEFNIRLRSIAALAGDTTQVGFPDMHLLAEGLGIPLNELKALIQRDAMEYIKLVREFPLESRISEDRYQRGTSRNASIHEDNNTSIDEYDYTSIHEYDKQTSPIEITKIPRKRPDTLRELLGAEADDPRFKNQHTDRQAGDSIVSNSNPLSGHNNRHEAIAGNTLVPSADPLSSHISRHKAIAGDPLLPSANRVCGHNYKHGAQARTLIPAYATHLRSKPSPFD